MEPSIHEGDYIYIKRTDTDSLKAGDIISFYSQDDSIKGEINTHRISEVLSNGTFVTKGDANKIEDSVTVQKNSIFQVAWVFCINKEAPHTVCDNPNSLHGGV